MANPCINNCTITASLLDLLGVVPVIDVADPPRLYVSAPFEFFHNESLILPFSKSTDFDVAGMASIDIIETETPQETLQIFITFPEGFATRVMQFVPAIIPKKASCPINQITIAKPFQY